MSLPVVPRFSCNSLAIRELRCDTRSRRRQHSVAAAARRSKAPAAASSPGSSSRRRPTTGGNRAFLIAPNGVWFLATSPHASASTPDRPHAPASCFDTSAGQVFTSRPLAISPDSRTVFARERRRPDCCLGRRDGTNWLQPHRHRILRDITQLSLLLRAMTTTTPRPTSELLSRYHLQIAFSGSGKIRRAITINPTQEYAIVGEVGDPVGIASRYGI